MIYRYHVLSRETETLTVIGYAAKKGKETLQSESEKVKYTSLKCVFKHQCIVFGKG